MLAKSLYFFLLLACLVVIYHVMTGREEDLQHHVSSVLHHSGRLRQEFEAIDLHVEPNLVEMRHEEVKNMEVLLLRVEKPRGVLLVFHGCNHKPTDWWHRTRQCITCIGLPEEVAIARTAMHHGLDVLALTAADHEHRCWDTLEPAQSVDIPRVLNVWEELEHRGYGWARVPRYALGASSGGAMALVLAQYMQLQGVCSQIMGVRPASLAQGPRMGHGGRPLWRHPPVFFVHMVRDLAMAEWIDLDLDALRRQGALAKRVTVRPRVLTPTFFAERIQGLGNDTSAALFHALQGAHLLDLEGVLVQDPRSSAERWQAALRENVPAIAQMSLEADTSPIHEELNVAWAGHELVSDYTQDMLAFFANPRLEEAAVLQPLGGGIMPL